MSLLNHVTVLILTYNEQANIARTLSALRRFSKIVVLDSGSDDGTQDIASSFPNVDLAIRPFDSHAAQWNHGLSLCHSAWVLALDADYVLPAALVDEIASLSPGPPITGYRVAFRYCVFGRPLSSTLYPPVLVLYRRKKARYVQEGHTQRVAVEGEIGCLNGLVDHDDRKPLVRWFTSQQKYMSLEADHLLSVPHLRLSRADRVRLMAWPAPILVFVYTLLIKRCVLDGWPGLLYVLQRTLAETMLALEIVDRRLRRMPTDPAQNHLIESVGPRRKP
jgi:glycosyltransferase involved in cell wall biosynthesis